MGINSLKILHIDANHPCLIEGLEMAGYDNQVGYNLSRIETLDIIDQFDGLVIRSRLSIDREFIDRATKLRFIARVGAGLDAIDVAYAQRKNITLISAPEGNSNAVGEHAMGFLLSLMNRLTRADRQVKSGHWQRELNRGDELKNKTVGIIGYGHMGQSFAKKLSGFDCRVLCHDLLPDKGDQYAAQVPLDVLFAEAQVLSLHTPLTPQTKNMVNKAFIDRFAHPFYLINTARGQSVVTQDLVEGLSCGKILGAGLDVIEFEKTSFEALFTEDPPAALQALIAMDQVIMSPHIAGWTHQSKERLGQITVDKIKYHFPL